MDRASSQGLLVLGETNRALATVSEYYYQRYSYQEGREILSLHNLVLILPENGATSNKFLLTDGVYFFPEKGILSLTCSVPCHQYCRQADLEVVFPEKGTDSLGQKLPLMGRSRGDIPPEGRL